MKPAKDHRDRVITGLVGLIIVFLVVNYGSKLVFFIFIFLLNFFALREFYHLASINRNNRWLGMGLGIGLTTIFFNLENPAFFGLIFGIVILYCLFQIINFKQPEPISSNFKKHLTVSFIVFFLSHLLWLRELSGGHLWIFFILSVAFSGDTFAFYGGKLLGKHKLSVKISPGKTIEGAILGLLGSVGIGYLFTFLFFPKFARLNVICLTVILGVLSQLGDLWESVLKRKAMVKDSGRLLPGHGGILDRVDSLFFSVPFLYYFIK
ncbi:MAG: phosphatidate cytidylyltransferase, partial [Desulfobacterota bacterium]|nr:phosphatidate cytidylyltransferase [Thermodesulfobacteriota bacterium]